MMRQRIPALIMIFIVAGVAFVATGACTGAMNRIYDQPVPAAAAVEHIAASRIFFAHQSVGDNIVAGLQTFPGIRIADLPNAYSGVGPAFFHARLGRNGDPKSKTDAFVAALDAGLGDNVSVAFQKYCFADIGGDTDVDRVFAYYRDAIGEAQRRFPLTRFVHVTVPLTVAQGGPKALVKKALGRMPDHYADNFARERFNSLMRAEYGARGLLFDLAALESTPPGRPPELIQFRERRSYSLLPEYSSDGGHLNAPAQAAVAGALVAFLDRALAGGTTTGF